MAIKAISLWQPWASLVANGLKLYETRGWPTKYRGVLAIHAAKRPLCKQGKSLISHFNRSFNLSIDGDKLPLGAIVALTDLTDCLEMVSEANATDVPNSIIVESVSELERLLGDWQPQRYAWKLENVRAIEPIPCLGKQKLFTVEIITSDFSLTGG